MAFPSWLPLGLAIRDYYETGKDDILRVHTVDGTVTPYPLSLFFRDYEDFGIFDELACSYARGRVLDVGAGAGCVSLFLQEMGMEVVAIDVATHAVDVMQKLGVRDARNIDFFDLEGEKFDTILLMMNGIGFVGTLDGLDRFLEYAKGLLNPGGQILFDSSDLKYADIDGTDFRADRQSYLGQVRYTLEYKGIRGEPYDWLYVDPKTVAVHAKRAGYEFEVLEEAAEGYYLGKLWLNDV